MSQYGFITAGGGSTGVGYQAPSQTSAPSFNLSNMFGTTPSFSSVAGGTSSVQFTPPGGTPASQPGGLMGLLPLGGFMFGSRGVDPAIQQRMPNATETIVQREIEGALFNPQNLATLETTVGTLQARQQQVLTPGGATAPGPTLEAAARLPSGTATPTTPTTPRTEVLGPTRSAAARGRTEGRFDIPDDLTLSIAGMPGGPAGSLVKTVGRVVAGGTLYAGGLTTFDKGIQGGYFDPGGGGVEKMLGDAGSLAVGVGEKIGAAGRLAWKGPPARPPVVAEETLTLAPTETLPVSFSPDSFSGFEGLPAMSRMGLVGGDLPRFEDTRVAVQEASPAEYQKLEPQLALLREALGDAFATGDAATIDRAVGEAKPFMDQIQRQFDQVLAGPSVPTPAFGSQATQVLETSSIPIGSDGATQDPLEFFAARNLPVVTLDDGRQYIDASQKTIEQVANAYVRSLEDESNPLFSRSREEREANANALATLGKDFSFESVDPGGFERRQVQTSASTRLGDSLVILSSLAESNPDDQRIQDLQTRLETVIESAADLGSADLTSRIELLDGEVRTLRGEYNRRTITPDFQEEFRRSVLEARGALDNARARLSTDPKHAEGVARIATEQDRLDRQFTAAAEFIEQRANDGEITPAQARGDLFAARQALETGLVTLANSSQGDSEFSYIDPVTGEKRYKSGELVKFFATVSAGLSPLLMLWFQKSENDLAWKREKERSQMAQDYYMQRLNAATGGGSGGGGGGGGTPTGNTSIQLARE